MPIYVYKCKKCGWTTEKYRDVKDRNAPLFCWRVKNGKSVCDGNCYRSYSDEISQPQIFEEYWDQHLANEDYPQGRLCTGNRQKSLAMKEMGFGFKEGGPGFKMNDKEREAWRHKIPLKKHFSGLNEKLRHRNSA